MVLPWEEGLRMGDDCNERAEEETKEPTQDTECVSEQVSQIVPEQAGGGF